MWISVTVSLEIWDPSGSSHILHLDKSAAVILGSSPAGNRMEVHYCFSNWTDDQEFTHQWMNPKALADLSAMEVTLSNMEVLMWWTIHSCKMTPWMGSYHSRTSFTELPSLPCISNKIKQCFLSNKKKGKDKFVGICSRWNINGKLKMVVIWKRKKKYYNWSATSSFTNET